MNKGDVEDAMVGAMLWTLIGLSAGLDFAERHRQWAPALALLLAVILADRHARRGEPQG